MKLKFDVEIMNMADEFIAVPVGDEANQFHGVLRVNETAADILEILKTATTEEEIVAELSKSYDTDKVSLAHYVHTFIEKLKGYDILID